MSKARKHKEVRSVPAVKVSQDYGLGADGMQASNVLQGRAGRLSTGTNLPFAAAKNCLAKAI